MTAPKLPIVSVDFVDHVQCHRPHGMQQYVHAEKFRIERTEFGGVFVTCKQFGHRFEVLPHNIRSVTYPPDEAIAKAQNDNARRGAA